ncbi:hypothetical protein VE25_01450 [Devosia geojensis]|uniref:HTH araC/xylS-type domain-containing protein n=2 Tax=Devosia geojensis TaxID=443610 RepID=A0A0F5FXH7_9HYPH|nr:hypothetical protein VE25_01450 [Devosia geojensis]
MGVVEKAIWFIESNFNRSPSLDDIARATGISRFSLSRSFTYATGMPVVAYLRARRLTEAYKALRDGAPSILAVALEAGYNSHEGFTRAFRDQFGITPDEARKGHDIDQRLLMESIGMHETVMADLEEPQRKQRDAFTVVGLGGRFRMDGPNTIPGLWQKFQPYEGTLGEVLGYWYGVCGDWKEDFFYMAGVEVARVPADLPAELTVHKFPAQDYLVFRHETHLSELNQTFAAIFGRYIPENGYHPRDCFELYDENFDPQTGLGGIEIWVPATRESGER